MKRYLFFIPGLLILFNTVLYSQYIRGKAADNTLAGETLSLYETIGIDHFKIDQCVIDPGGNFQFPGKKYPMGYYQLGLDDTNRVTIILNPLEEAVELYFSDKRLKYGIKVLVSKENRLLWQYKMKSKETQEKLKPLWIKKSYVPKTDTAALRAIREKINQLEKEKEDYLRELIDRHRDTYFALACRAFIRGPGKNNKSTYFNDLDFSDPRLIRSSVFPVRIMEYLQYYTSYDEKGFKDSIDYILGLARLNEKVYEFCLHFLLEVFDEVGPDIIFQYLVEEYLLAEGCGNIEVSRVLKNKAAAYRKLQTGNQAPDLSLQDMNDEPVTISRVAAKNRYTLLFFWSSQCGFCQRELPRLAALYKMYRDQGLQIIAISLDRDKNDWRQAVEKEALNWINLSDLKGWKSKAVELYKIHKTPGFYLLDRQMRIVGKPKNIDHLIEELKI